MRWSEHFYYDESSPTCLRWKVDRHRKSATKSVLNRAGDQAGNLCRRYGYCIVRFEDKNLRVHRIIWEIHNGKIPEGLFIDHINGKRSDNRIYNLRLVDTRMNAQNSKKFITNTSGKVGVSRNFTTSRYGKKYFNWTASWRNLDGVYCRQSFSIDKLGEELAFKLACEHRDKMIEELNAAGACYTERHGRHRE